MSHRRSRTNLRVPDRQVTAKSLSDIAARFVKAGYHPAAYNEGFDVLDEGATPYLFLSSILGRAGVPCSEILDPRFRDLGIGATVAGAGVDTLALELGLRVGQRQPSGNTGPATTCPHKPPAPVVTGMPVVPAGAAPTAAGAAVTLRLRCAAHATCTLTSTLSLPDAGASADSGTVTIPAGATRTISYTFAGNAVSAERSSPNPHVSLRIRVTAPVPYSGTRSAAR